MPKPKPTPNPTPPPPKPFAYRPPDPKRATLLFDLDHTLVQVQSQDHYRCVEMPKAATQYQFPPTSSAPTFDRFPAHGWYSTIPNLKDAAVTQDIVHYRPHIVPFLRFCFEHFNVGFWSTAAAINVHHIALNLLRLVDRQPADLMCAWARRNLGGPPNEPPEAVHFIDALTNEELQPPARGVRVSSNHKDLHYVYAKFPKLRRRYITLVDNLPDHAVGNPLEGVLWMPPFSFLNAHDAVLDVLLRRLQRLWRERCAVKGAKKGKGAVAAAKGDATDGENAAAAPVAAGTETVDAATVAEEAATVVTAATTGTATAPTTATKANPPPKPIPPPPLLVNADDLRACLLGVSGTNDGELYPGGYVTNGYNRAYALSARRLRRYQPVILSANGRYLRGSVRKIDRAKGTATVRVTRPATPPPDVAYTAETPGKGTRKPPAVAAKGTRRRRIKAAAKPTYEERVVPVSALVDGTVSQRYIGWAYGGV